MFRYLLIAGLGFSFGCTSPAEQIPEMIDDDVALERVGPFHLGMDPEAAFLAAIGRDESLVCHIQGNYFLCQPSHPPEERELYTLLFEGQRLVLIGWDVNEDFADVKARFNRLAEQAAEEQTPAPGISGIWVNSDSTVMRDVACPQASSPRGSCVVTAALTNPEEAARAIDGMNGNVSQRQ